ncbi:MAG: hypothetical protein JRF59_10910 [Deltaproteobacteria bacterium]|nr:hypothetical protein [Deltaproteobacteria bacterium]MBW1924656.1 hypothetical protein [Deltaproteobacteria bacterium]MBW1950512.1 hypothetical protein [Deltaproteobacteria bacterium]MBW2103057.1 hypothetical protein [Deltaproteobacteria bacterium]MBW2348337.1 hypothetical protein [Deltaproteobacteria bacterium]
MVDIVIGQTTALNPNAPGPKTHGTETEKWPHKERRKNKQDRRRSVREGIYVTLSVKNDRRKLRDRRRNPW